MIHSFQPAAVVAALIFLSICGVFFQSQLVSLSANMWPLWGFFTSFSLSDYMERHQTFSSSSSCYIFHFENRNTLKHLQQDTDLSWCHYSNSSEININSVLWIPHIYKCEIPREQTLYELIFSLTSNYFWATVSPIRCWAYVLHFRIHIPFICIKEIWKGYESLVIIRKHVSEKLIHDQLPVSSNLLHIPNKKKVVVGFCFFSKV